MSPKDRRRAALLRAAVAVLAAVSLTAAAPAVAPAAQKGLNVDLTWGISTADQDRTGEPLRDLSTQWVRIEIDWYWLGTNGLWEGRPTGWTAEQIWAHYDRAIEVARRAGARVLLMMQRCPPELSHSDVMEAPPADPADMTDFMRTLARRYKDSVDEYEIWNEPNSARFWPSGVDAAGYVRLLKAARAGVKAADPSADVVFVGTAFNDHAFIADAYRAEPQSGRYFDVMATHPYVAAARPENVWQDADGSVDEAAFPAYRTIHDLMLAHGDDKPIWATEFGWSTATSAPGVLAGVSEQEQADYLTRALRYLEQDPAGCFLYNLRNNFALLDAGEFEGRFGLLRTDFSPKPAYSAFKRYVPLEDRPLHHAPIVAARGDLPGRTGSRTLPHVECAASDGACTGNDDHHAVARLGRASAGRAVGVPRPPVLPGLARRQGALQADR